MARAFFQQNRYEAADSVDDTEHVDVVDPAPVVDRELPGTAPQIYPGVQAHDVDAAEPVEGPAGEGGDLVVLGDVGANGEHLRAADPQALLRPRERVPVDVGDHDAHPSGHEAGGQSEPETARRAGDDGDTCFAHDAPSPR